MLIDNSAEPTKKSGTVQELRKELETGYSFDLPQRPPKRDYKEGTVKELRKELGLN